MNLRCGEGGLGKDACVLGDEALEVLPELLQLREGAFAVFLGLFDHLGEQFAIVFHSFQQVLLELIEVFDLLLGRLRRDLFDFLHEVLDIELQFLDEHVRARCDTFQKI